MLACRTFAQNAAKILKSPLSNSEAVRYVTGTTNVKGIDYTNPLASVLEGPPLDQRLELKNNQIVVSSVVKPEEQFEQGLPYNSQELREDYNKFYEIATPQITSLFTENNTSKRVKDTLNNFHRHVMEQENKEKNGEGKHVERLNSKNDALSR
ncbi:MAG: hypothetical protein PQ612_01600 [Rickettsiales bacterium]|nr:hypothetical protein [Pseudomonadota bacterium]MDA0965389.1 hypothetical protein [Pseudomonadota bacterium]MDG4544317.1 hypothetical protein [Rickettsiales bacterium]MDG4544838.1 hypothetical protein [Rickettsiales bacterium]MDG4546960.1 hypothetical protein [Rickettsiales bacterium]